MHENVAAERENVNKPAGNFHLKSGVSLLTPDHLSFDATEFKSLQHGTLDRKSGISVDVDAKRTNVNV